MAGALDTIQEILTGMIHGTQMHAELQRSQDEHDMMQRQAAQQDRSNRIQDLQQQMILNDNSRAVSPAGTVTADPTNVPSILSSMTGGSPDVGGQQLGGPLATMQTMLPGVVRKADSSRVVKYQTQDGQTIQRERYSPEERNQKAAKSKADLAHAGEFDAAPLIERLIPGFRTPGQMFTTPAQLPALLKDIMDHIQKTTLHDVPKEAQDLWGVAPQLMGEDYEKLMAKHEAYKQAQAKETADAAKAAAKEAADAADKEKERQNRLAIARIQAGAKDPLAMFGMGPAVSGSVTPGATGLAGTPQVALPKGIGQAPSDVIFHQFFKAAGGDKEKTRQLLQQYRWRVQ